MRSPTNRLVDFILGFLVADILGSLFFYLRHETVQLHGFIVRPDFFMLVVFVDIIVIALLLKLNHNKFK